VPTLFYKPTFITSGASTLREAERDPLLYAESLYLVGLSPLCSNRRSLTPWFYRHSRSADLHHDIRLVHFIFIPPNVLDISPHLLSHFLQHYGPTITWGFITSISEAENMFVRYCVLVLLYSSPCHVIVIWSTYLLGIVGFILVLGPWTR
jgi:hypothetical protein